jgi:hypothetical protein
MALDARCYRLQHLPGSSRIVVSLFAVLIGIGYLVAMAHLYFTYSGVDGKPGVTPRDLQLTFHGMGGKTVLAAAIDGGKMEQYLRSPAEKAELLSWIHAGAAKESFHSVQPIFTNNCAGCHSSSGPAKFRLLTNYEQVAAVTEVDRGESLAAFARIAHTHIQSLALVYLALGLLFCFTAIREGIKTVVVSTPFLALATDFGARGLARIWPEMAYLVLASGMLLGLATALMILGILLDLWLPKKPRHIWEPALAA